MNAEIFLVLMSLFSMNYGLKAYPDKCDMKVLSFDSTTRDWFNLTLEPSASDDKTNTMLYRYGWVKARDDADKSNDVKSFHVKQQTDQKITIEAEGGNSFTVQHFSLKTINVKEVIITGLDYEENVVFKKTRKPRDMKPFDKWQKTSFRAKTKEIAKLEIIAIWQRVPPTDKHSYQREFIRGLRLKTCPVVTEE